MSRVGWRRYLALACVALTATVVLADPLRQPPAPWSEALAVVEDTDLSGLEERVRKVVTATRAEVARLLRDPGTEREALGEAYGRLATLYDVYEIPAAARTAYLNAIALQP
ncbi:MAG: hypothetical protein ACFCUG_06835, partial [Thiotrichales bacterium]